VGSGHPTKADTLNRLALVEHNTDGTHKIGVATATSINGVKMNTASFTIASGANTTYSLGGDISYKCPLLIIAGIISSVGGFSGEFLMTYSNTALEVKSSGMASIAITVVSATGVITITNNTGNQIDGRFTVIYS